MLKQLFILPFLFLLVTRAVWADDSQKDSSSNIQSRVFELRPATCLLCATVLIKSHGQALALKREFEATDSGITIRYLLGDSGKLEDMNWAVEMLKRAKRILVATSTKGGNPPLCPLCALVSDIIKSGATLTAGLKDSECIVKINYPDSLAEMKKNIVRNLPDSIIGQFKGSEGAITVRANISILGVLGVRNVKRDTGIIFTYVPLATFLASKPSTNIDKKPTVLIRVLPDYPPVARGNGVQGSVAFEVLIDTNGQVTDEKLLHQTSYSDYLREELVQGLFDSSVRDCLKQWVFKPAVVNGRAVNSSYQDSIFFRVVF